MIVAEFSITPVGEDEMRPFVDAAVEEVKNSGLKYEVDAMGTTFEGDIDQVLDVVKKAHQKIKEMGAQRVMTELRIDDKAEGVTMDEVVEGYRSSV